MLQCLSLVKVPTITLPAPHKGLLLLSAQNAKLLSVQNAKLLNTGSFDKTPNFAPVVLHGLVMNSKKSYCLLLLFTVYIYREDLFFLLIYYLKKLYYFLKKYKKLSKENYLKKLKYSIY